jgi:two-component system, NtrC family, response regulator AtoC
MRGHVLVIDDDPDLCRLLGIELGRRGFTVTWKTSATEALELLGRAEIDVIVTDLRMPGMDGLELCERMVANHPDVPVLILTGAGSLETAIAAIRAGAYDFIPKPFVMDALALALERAVEHRLLREEVKRLRRAASDAPAFEGLLGTSPAMQTVYDFLERVAHSDASVVITGETGTGKELVARALHRRGRRNAGAFVAINCATVPEALLESELFGHLRGAFTDARESRTGLFVQANGGTLFLDEIAELPLALQQKLLRALQERAVRPLGADAEVPFDVRLVAATNQDLEAAVEAGRLREDLYFRINVVHVDLPPLRARGDDVLLLAQHFLQRHAAKENRRVQGIALAAAERLMAYGWPGNVRELENCIERAVALARYEQIVVDDLPEKIRRYRHQRLAVTSGARELVSLDDAERQHILQVLDAVEGNRKRCAEVLGIDRKTLQRKLERYRM